MADVYRQPEPENGAPQFELYREEGRHNSEISIRLTAEGTGKHAFRLRAFNARFSNSKQTLELVPGKQEILSWKGSIDNPSMPWVIVVHPAAHPDQRKEVFGSNWHER